MNLLAFILVLAAGIIGVVLVFLNGWKFLPGWALALLSAGVIIQDVFIHWTKTVHN